MAKVRVCGHRGAASRAPENTLAGIALVWIAVVPMAEIAEHPVVGLSALVIILVGLVAGHRLPWGVPAGLAAILIGTLLFAAQSWARGQAEAISRLR